MSDDDRKSSIEELRIEKNIKIVLVIVFILVMILAIPYIVIEWDDMFSHLMKPDENCWEIKELEGREPIAFNTCTGESKPLGDE